ncbi:MAG: DUF5916 domain-containing protein [Holophagae bacterium]|jgi:hypothetical protein
MVRGCLISFPLCTALVVAAPGIAGERPSLVVTPLEQAPEIDGVIGDTEWNGVPVDDRPFIQFEPDAGRPSPFRTTVRVAQTDTALYVAVEADDPDPGQIASAVTRRDGDIGDDDSVGVVLDTFSDRRTGYAFITNVLATQWDARIADNGRTVDELWDAEWRCASRRHDTGWTVELEIPFAVLRYRAGDDRRWGLSFLRTVPRRLETSVWAGPTEDPFRVSSFGTLEGLQLTRGAAKTWLAIPYGLAVIDESGATDLEVGGDVRWRPSSALGVDLTVNPDFALIEADVEVINLTRFELFIPEKRPFFLEGNERYEQRIRQFYSRRIGDITWGGKATGTAGRMEYGAILTSEDRVDPDSGGTRRADSGIARLQYSLPRGSTLGFLGANRRLGGTDQGSIGLDTTLFFTDTLGFTGQLLRVNGPTADGGLAWFVRPAYDSATTHFHIRYTNLDRSIADDFNAVGFLQDDDRREFDTNVAHVFWFDAGTVEKIKPEVNYNRYYSQDGDLRSWQLDAELKLVFRSRWEIEVELIDEYEVFEKGFRNDRVRLETGWDSRDGRSVFVFAATGTNYDSDLRLYGAEAAWAFGDRLRFEYSATRLELDPDPDDETTWIHVLSTVYNFNPDLFVKLFVQSNSAVDKVNVQAVGVWRFTPPFGSIQVAYQRGTSDIGEFSDQGDTLFTKLSWVF